MIAQHLSLTHFLSKKPNTIPINAYENILSTSHLIFSKLLTLTGSNIMRIEWVSSVIFISYKYELMQLSFHTYWSWQNFLTYALTLYLPSFFFMWSGKHKCYQNIFGWHQLWTNKCNDEKCFCRLLDVEWYNRFSQVWIMKNKIRINQLIENIIYQNHIISIYRRHLFIW